MIVFNIKVALPVLLDDRMETRDRDVMDSDVSVVASAQLHFLCLKHVYYMYDSGGDWRSVD